MPNIAKKFIDKSRQHLLWEVTKKLEKITDRFAVIEEKMDTLQGTQLQINHYQHELMEEVNHRTKNSGTLVLSEKEMVTKIFSGLKMYLDPRDMAISVPLALDSVWEHQITSAFLAILGPNDTVFDIGANNGYYGALAAQKTDKKKAKVFLFEANPHLIPYIRKTLSVNWLNEQSTLEQLAVADKPGELTLNILQDYVGSSSVHSLEHTEAYMKGKMQLAAAESVKVQAVTIDDYCKKHKVPAIDLMIMDIEGFEDKAYAGMRKTVQASPNMSLMLEFTKGSYDDPKAFYEQMLSDFGHVYTIDDAGFIVKPEATDYKSIIEVNDDWVMPIFSKKADLANK